MLASLVLGFTTFDTLSKFVVVWLHSTPMWPCSDVTMWDASPDASCFMHTLPFFYSMWWYAYHVCLCHLLALYTSLHACLHVHVWVLFASVSSILQHNEVMDFQSKPIFVPRRHHLLCVFLLVCPFVYVFAFSHAILSMSIKLIYFMPFHAHFAHFPSIACLLVSYLCLCMYAHGARTYGAKAQSLRRKQKGHRCKHMVEPGSRNQ